MAREAVGYYCGALVYLDFVSSLSEYAVFEGGDVGNNNKGVFNLDSVSKQHDKNRR